MTDPFKVRITGPLSSQAQGFATELIRVGYSPRTVRDYVYMLAWVSRWLADEGLTAVQLTPEVVDRFLLSRRTAGHRRWCTRRSLEPMLGFLRDAQAVPAAEYAGTDSAAGALLLAYRRYLVGERRLAAASVTTRVAVARRFLSTRDHGGDLQLDRLTPADVTGFVLGESRRCRPGSMKVLTVALRCLLRFLFLTGVAGRDLSAAVPAVTHRASGLPRGVDAATVVALLDSCDRSTPVGLRDHAIVTLLVRLGLRASEVAALRLDDVDWRAGELVVRGKGNRIDRLPLPADVGAVLVDYLCRARRRSPCRALFLRACGPGRGDDPTVGDDGAAHRLDTGRAADGRGASATAHGRNRNAARAARDRASSSSPRRGEHRDLRLGRPGRAGRRGAPLAGSRAVSALRDAAEDYLAIRRACGYTLRQEGRMLASYLDHLERAGTTRVSVATALAWAVEPSQADPSWWAKRLTVVRGFARYLATIDDDSEVPPDGLLPNHAQRRTPYLYSPAQIAELMATAGLLAHPLRAATFATVIGLMACTGLRTGETMRLDRDDVDLDDNLLTVRNSKHGKSRLVPLHPSTSTELRGYAVRRDELCPHPASPAFFLSGAGTRLNHTNASSTFAGLRAAAGITAPPRRRPARLTDLRHSFAVATLLTWYADGADVPARLPALSTYLGHSSEPEWFYDLHGAVRELLEQNGDVPFLAGRALAADARSFEDIAELDFRRPDEDPDEIDIAVVVDGRLVIGEAKCVASLGTRKEANQAIAKLVRASDLLGADEILLATTAPGSSEPIKGASTVPYTATTASSRLGISRCLRRSPAPRSRLGGGTPATQGQSPGASWTRTNSRVTAAIC